jgi:putative transposase
MAVIPPNMEEIGRKHPVHLAARERHNTPIIVFLTVCTKNRKTILANPDAHKLLRAAWTGARSWLTGRYLIMPDHVHLFCAPGDLIPQPLTQWVNFWKSHAARHWPHCGDAPIWQRHFWDTQLRRGENYEAKWEYVEQNPVRAGLVSQSDDWPYQGELNVLSW